MIDSSIRLIKTTRNIYQRIKIKYIEDQMLMKLFSGENLGRNG